MSLLATHSLFSPGDFAERVVQDRKRVLLAAVYADRSLPVLHQLQPRVLLAAAARWVPFLLLCLGDGLCLLLPSLPQRAHPQLPGLHRTGRAVCILAPGAPTLILGGLWQPGLMSRHSKKPGAGTHCRAGPGFSWCHLKSRKRHHVSRWLAKSTFPFIFTNCHSLGIVQDDLGWEGGWS